MRQVGLVGTARHTVRKLRTALQQRASPFRLATDAFDAAYGTDTALIVSVGSLDIPDDKLEHTNRYEAVVPQVLDAILQQLPIEYGDFTFIDIGSGKGRALLLASRYPFRSIIGVEISAALTDIALRNIRRFTDNLQSCKVIQAVCSDALAYELPQEDTILYCNNPFDEQLMRMMLNHIEQSLRDYPRTLFVIYQRALYRKLWDESSMFEVVENAERYVLYRSVSN